MSSFMNVSVSAYDVAHGMSSDADFAYEVLSELVQHRNGSTARFFERLYNNIDENEDDDLIFFLEEMIESFKEEKAANELSNSDSSA